MSNAIETRGVEYTAGRQFAIRNLSLTVPAGALYGFLGPNGSGKTTTIRLLLGLLRPKAGTIRLLEQPVPSALPRILARTGVVPDRPHLHRHLTVGEAIAYHAAFFPTWDAAWAESLRKEFRLGAGQVLRGLSKGEMAKVMILLALCQTPDLLVLDEPTEGLDPVVRRDVLAALLDYVSRRGATVFISSHLIHEVERFCDWIGVMDEGSLVAELPMAQFRSGIKRVRVAASRELMAQDAPFTVLGREREEGSLEAWVVRGWEADMAGWFARAG
ncbi:MAG: ABC transporter ATP-binding protein, partial [Gemmatimonadales bacterium]